MNSGSKSLRPQILRRSKVIPESTQFCSYSHRVCMQMRLEGYDHCARHILEDKNSPFKQCQYVSNKTSKRCTSAALRNDKKEGYCPDHARRAAQLRFRAGRKRRLKETPELLLEELEHYMPRASSSSAADSKKNRSSESTSAKIIELMSSSDSEMEALTVEQTWRGDGDSDAESVDSEQEDPLKHAGTYTAEEVALITRDKLIRLQSLYIDQFKRLQHVMKEKRRRYLHTVSRERELLGSIRYAKDDPVQRSKYDELVAMKRYHRRYGQEALLHRQSKERRIAVSEGINYKPPSYPKCILTNHSGRCGARTVPLSKYCLQHMLQDPHQVLYRECGFGQQCKRPIVPTVDKPSCRYHAQPRNIEYRLPKKEEKDESKDEIDVVGDMDTKPEDPHQSLQLQLQLQQDQLKQANLPNMQQETTATTNLAKMQQDTMATTNLPKMQQDTIATTSLPKMQQDTMATTSLPKMKQETMATTSLPKMKQDLPRDSILDAQHMEEDKQTKESKPAIANTNKALSIPPQASLASSQLKGECSVKQPDSLGLNAPDGKSGNTTPSVPPKLVQSQLGLLKVDVVKDTSAKPSTPSHVPSSEPPRITTTTRITQDHTGNVPSSIRLVRCSSQESKSSLSLPIELIPQAKATNSLTPRTPITHMSQEKGGDLPTQSPLIPSTSRVKQTGLSCPDSILSPIPASEVPQVVNDLLVMERELVLVKQSQVLKRHEITSTKTSCVNNSTPQPPSAAGMASTVLETSLKGPKGSTGEILLTKLSKPASDTEDKTETASSGEATASRNKPIPGDSTDKRKQDIEMVDLTHSDDSVPMDTS